MAQLKSTSVVGNISATGNLLASKIIKLGGTASQILMADGSVMDAEDVGAGTVTSVGVSSSSLTVTGSPITGAGTINIEHPTTTATTADIYKIGKDDKGHVVIGAKITPADLGLSQVYKYKGTKTWAELKALTAAEIGDVYSITDKDPDGNTNADWACYTKVTAATGDNYATYWQSLGGKVDLSAYVQGPATSTANAVARYNSTSGKIIKDSSGVTIDDNNNFTASGKVTQGAKNTDSSITNMNQFTADLYVKGDGSAPDQPTVAGFYLGKSASDENRHMDIVTGSTVSYIDFNRASVKRDYDFRFRVNNDSGNVLMQWNGGYSAAAKLFKIDGGILEATTIKKTGGADTHVLLAGGGTKALTEFVTSDGTKVTSDKVIMSKNLTYTAAIGVLSKPSGGSGTIECEGKTLDQFLSSILAKREQPKVTQPSISIQFTNSTLKYEIGTKVTPTYSITKSAGSYTYGPSTGVTFSNVKATLSGSADKTADSGSFDEVQLTGTLSCSVSASHSAGATPVDNLGDTATVSAIAAKTSISNTSSNSFTVYRKTFYGAPATQISSFTASAIRGLAQSSTSTLANGSKFTITIPSGARQVVFAYPADLRDVTSVKDVNGMNAEVKTAFTKLSTTVSVPGAENYSAIAYKVYYTNFASGANANSYEVTI